MFSARPARIVLGVIAACSMLITAPRTAAAAGITSYHLEQTVPWTATACGYTFTGWFHEQQQFTLTPTGQLNFHYIANGHADGIDASGKTAILELNNKEVDHIISKDPPNLAESEGSLQKWIAANTHIVVEVNALFNLRVVGKGKGQLLQNQWVFEANHTGTQVDSIRFVAGNCP